MKKLSLVFLLFIGCMGEESPNIDEEYESFLKEDSFQYVSDYKLSDSQIKDFQALGYGGSDIIVISRTDDKTNLKSISFLLENDIELSANQLTEMAKEYSKESSYGKTNQYRTTNLVAPGTYKISTGNLSPNVAEGLTRAVQNFNNLNLSVRFTLKIYTGNDFGAFKLYQQTWGTGSKIVVTEIASGNSGAYAGFPSNGNPYRYIRIFSSSSAFGPDVCEHILTHELGHCIGLRHTDWFDRSISCGGLPQNEGDSGVGVIHIPGTPETTGIDLASVMMSCFNGLESGEFTDFDVTALNFLY